VPDVSLDVGSVSPRNRSSTYLSYGGSHFVARRSTARRTVRDVVIEQQPSRLRVVGGGTGVRTHSSRTTGRRHPVAHVPQRTILYIGADPECQIILSRIVRRMDNAQLVVAGSGREGRLSALARSPSLILLDSHLPDCGAQDLMVYFGRAALRATVPIAVVSAHDEERLRFIQAGAVAWMTKPLRIDDVERSMLRLLDLFSPG
jgi:CheY-like chemotaxis protein